MRKLTNIILACLIIVSFIFCCNSPNAIAAGKWWTVNIVSTSCAPDDPFYVHWVTVEHVPGGYIKYLRFNSKEMLAVLLTADSINEQVTVVFDDGSMELLQVSTIND